MDWPKIFATALDYATAASFVLALFAYSSDARSAVGQTSGTAWLILGVACLLAAASATVARTQGK